MTDPSGATDQSAENTVSGANSALGGGLLMTASIFVANVAGYAANWLLARRLSPAEFAEFTLIATLQASLGFLTLATMLAVSKYTTIKRAHHALPIVNSMRSWLSSRALLLGVLLFLLLSAGSPILAQLFHTQSVWLFILLAISMPVFILIATERGILQGLLRFDLHTVSFQVEVWVKFAGLLAVAFLGLGANGSAAFISLSVICGWLVARQYAKRMLPTPATQKFTELSLLGQGFGSLLVVYFSQVVINNSDLLLVKSYYPADDAGHYAVLVLIGRIIFYGTWSATLTIFPIVAHRNARGEPHSYLFYGAFGFVAIIALVATLMAGIFPNQFIGSAFGSQYLVIAPLLWRYAFATSLYALANVIVNYHIALGKTGGTFFVLGGGLLQIAGIMLFHRTLNEVVLVQIGVMAALLVVLFAWHLTLSPDRSFVRPDKSAG